MQKDAVEVAEFSVMERLFQSKGAPKLKAYEQVFIDLTREQVLRLKRPKQQFMHLTRTKVIQFYLMRIKVNKAAPQKTVGALLSSRTHLP